MKNMVADTERLNKNATERGDELSLRGRDRIFFLARFFLSTVRLRNF